MRKEEISRIRELVAAQIIDSLGYLPNAFRWSMRACLIVVLAYAAFFLVSHKKPSVISTFQFALRLIWLFTFVTYSYCVLQLTILSRTPVPHYDHIDWVFLSRWFDSNEQKAFYIANIVMFFPLGILLPMAGKPMRHILIAAPVATACSIGIEAVQLKYHLGACQLDDVLLNSFGFLMGFLVYLALADVYELLSAIVKFLYRHSKELLRNESSHLQS
ncbi:MAG: VanZ family protein [Lachnospiraceae bacterium]|nr:VanZ family protein [Lachnospiraceae bacterium]